jgi:hypothetical protein
MILASIRRLVYRLGFWPHPRSPLYSPSLALNLSYLKAIKDTAFPVMIDLGNKPAWAATTIALDQIERDHYSEKKDEQQSLYHAMNFCIMCGSPLIPLVVDIKECPHQHGRVRIRETEKGLPGIMFELTEEVDAKWRPNS